MLALFVVMLGAYTRLSDSGLGCPDWPGCYGHMVLPSNASDLSKAQSAFPSVTIETHKAWTEMAHRYAAGTLGLLIFAIVLLGLKKRGQKVGWFPFALAVLVVFQALLGMWTVTLKLLPIVVMGHLLGGVLIFASLCGYRFQLSQPHKVSVGKLKPLIALTAVCIFLQIALGGWVSANYAGIACLGFPACNGVWLPDLHLKEAFNLISPIGENYQGGMLDIHARITIQYIHRIGAIITLFLVYYTAAKLLFNRFNNRIRVFAALSAFCVSLQFLLGIANVVFVLPLWVAVSHNGVAAILLGMMVALFAMTSGDKPHAN